MPEEEPKPGDWCEQVHKDFDKIGVHMAENRLAALDADSYKKIIKQAVRSKAFEDLQLLKEEHSKVRDNVYLGLKCPQAYLTDKSVTTQERSVIFWLKKQNIKRN